MVELDIKPTSVYQRGNKLKLRELQTGGGGIGFFPSRDRDLKWFVLQASTGLTLEKTGSLG